MSPRGCKSLRILEQRAETVLTLPSCQSLPGDHREVAFVRLHQLTEDSTSLRLASEEVREDSSPIEARLTTSIRPDDQQGLRRPISGQMLGAEVARLESAKSNKASACRRSETASGRACLIPRKVPEDTPRSLGSRESLAHQEMCIPEYQLERYVDCSKRNGLQDECITPLLRAVSTKGQQEGTLEKCIERERINWIEEDRGGTRKSTCAQRDQRVEIVFRLE